MHLCVCLSLVVLMVGRGDRNQAENKKKKKLQLMAAIGSHFHGVLGVKVGAVVLAETGGENVSGETL